MAFKLSITSAQQDRIIHLAAQGDAVAADFPLGPGGHLFEALLGANWSSRLVVLNMEGVPYVDSSAIGWLIGSQKSFRTGGGHLVLHSVQPTVRNVFNLLKIDRVVPIAEDPAEAQAVLLSRAQVP